MSRGRLMVVAAFVAVALSVYAGITAATPQSAGSNEATTSGAAGAAGDAPAAGTDADAKPGAARRLETATFAGGCFWCMEPPFDKTEGVVETISGYTGGASKNPTYKDVSAGRTNHAEAVQVRYDPARVDYADLVAIFWRNVDPTTPDRQFCDRGSQYRTAIYYHGEQQREIAERSRREIEDSGRLPGPIVTEITAAKQFYPAEEYHQDYYEKNPVRYKYYRWNCGRDQRLEELWGRKPS